MISLDVDIIGEVKDRLLWFEADLEKTALSSVLLLGFKYIIHQIKGYNFLYQLIYLEY